MHRTFAILASSFSLAVPALSQSSSAHLPPQYEAQVLATSAWGLAIPNDINNRGVVVGEWDSGTTFADPRHAVLWGRGLAIDLSPDPKVVRASATGINDDGVVSGFVLTNGATLSAGVRWTTGAAEVLPTLVPGHQRGLGISESGFVVGLAMQSGFQVRSTAWDPLLRNLDLGTLGAGTGAAHDMNGWDAIVGASGAGGGRTHEFLWQQGQMHDLGTLPGHTIARAHAINDRQEVVGVSGAGLMEHATYWTPATGLVRLGGLHPGWNSSANDINDDGVVVGYSYGGGTGRVGVVWYGMAAHDLNSLLVDATGWELSDANGINELGQIVGHGRRNGAAVAYLLTPVGVSMTTLIGPSPGKAGASNRIEVIEATPGSVVRVYVGTVDGSAAVDGCPGAEVDIAAPRAFEVVADAEGRAQVELDLPGSMRGQRILAQAVDLASCELTNRSVRRLD